MSDEKRDQSQASDAEVTRREALTAAGAVAVAAVTAGQGQAEEAPSKKFDPNKLTFADCVERIKHALKDAGLEKNRIVTSQDAAVQNALESLRCEDLPHGFKKYQLPVYFDGGPGSHFFISIGNPDAKVPKHSHKEGDGLRFIVSGSIIYEGKHLGAGDWMFLPKGAPYSFTVGKYGVVMFYCYQCCCK